MLVVRQISTTITRIYVLILSTCSLIYAPAGILYGPPNANTIASLVGTNFQEASEYLSMLPHTVWYVWCGTLSLSIILIVFIKNLPKISIRWSLILLIFGIGVACSSIVKNLQKDIQTEFSHIKFNELRLAYDVYISWNNYRSGKAQSISVLTANPQWNSVSTSSESPEISVLVIGESVRRDFMGAYNSSFSNTPWLSKSPGIHFTNYVAPYASTAGVLSRMLFWQASPGKGGDTIVTLMQAAGYKVSWLSAQGDGAQLSSPASLVAWRADEKLLEKRNYISTHDRDLVPFFEEAVSKPGKRFVGGFQKIPREGFYRFWAQKMGVVV